MSDQRYIVFDKGTLSKVNYFSFRSRKGSEVRHFAIFREDPFFLTSDESKPAYYIDQKGKSPDLPFRHNQNLNYEKSYFSDAKVATFCKPPTLDKKK